MFKHWKRSLFVLTIGLIGFLGSYSTTNWINSYREHHHHLYMQWELAIPLIPWTILIYISAYICPFWPLFRLNLRRKWFLLRSMLFAALYGCTFFLLVPTIVGWPREPAAVEGPFKIFFEWLWIADYPHNLVPSLHACLAYLLTLPCIQLMHQRWKKLIALIWPTAIALSILTTHQHHLLDLFSGVGLALFCWKFHYVNALRADDRRRRIIARANKNVIKETSDEDLPAA